MDSTAKIKKGGKFAKIYFVQIIRNCRNLRLRTRHINEKYGY